MGSLDNGSVTEHHNTPLKTPFATTMFSKSTDQELSTNTARTTVPPTLSAQSTSLPTQTESFTRETPRPAGFSTPTAHSTLFSTRTTQTTVPPTTLAAASSLRSTPIYSTIPAQSFTNTKFTTVIISADRSFVNSLIGGPVGGLVVLIIILSIIVLSLRRYRHKARRRDLKSHRVRIPEQSGRSSGFRFNGREQLDSHELYSAIFSGQTGPNNIRLMKVVFESMSSSKTHDVFVYYHYDNAEWIQTKLLPRLQNQFRKTVKSQEDFDIGTILMEEYIAAIRDCEFIILTFSTSFIVDFNCRDFTIRSYAMRPHAVVPIAVPPLNIGQLENDILFCSIIQTNGVIFWSDTKADDERFMTLLERRLNADQMQTACSLETELIKAAYKQYADLATQLDYLENISAFKVQSERMDSAVNSNGLSGKTTIEINDPSKSLVLHKLPTKNYCCPCFRSHPSTPREVVLKSNHWTLCMPSIEDVLQHLAEHPDRRHLDRVRSCLIEKRFQSVCNFNCQIHVGFHLKRKSLKSVLLDIFTNPSVLGSRNKVIVCSLDGDCDATYVDDKLFQIRQTVIELMKEDSYNDIVCVVSYDLHFDSVSVCSEVLATCENHLQTDLGNAVRVIVKNAMRDIVQKEAYLNEAFEIESTKSIKCLNVDSDLRRVVEFSSISSRDNDNVMASDASSIQCVKETRFWNY
jgi:hypothetical protein